MNVPALRTVFASLRDPLEGERRGHPLGATLTMVFLALLSGENSVRGCAAWVREQRWRLKPVFGFRNGQVPSLGTIQRALREVDLEELNAKLSGWAEQILAQVGETTWSGLAIDGKTLRGSRGDEQAALHVLNVFSQQLGLVLQQRPVNGKTNEIPELQTLLETLTLEGRLVTVDALHTQRETARRIVKKGGTT